MSLWEWVFRQNTCHCRQNSRIVNVFRAGAEKLSAGGQALLDESVAYKQYIETNNINKSLLVLGAMYSPTQWILLL